MKNNQPSHPIVTAIQEDFTKIFHREAEHLYFAPGRVNLIGEHTDYNGGHVFPCALQLGIYAGVSKRSDSLLRLYSKNSATPIFEFSINDLSYASGDSWTNYPKGVFHLIQEIYGIYPFGLDIYYWGDIPSSSGLSSSAAIEVLTATIINDVYRYDMDGIEIAKITQKAENIFVGVQCGILDQFAVAMGKEDSAILLDTNTLKYSYVPLHLGDYCIVIANTNKKRGLEDSKYNERRAQCEKALSILQAHTDIRALGELTEEAFDALSHHIEDPVLLRRARHAVYENRRTLRAYRALEQNDILQFGQLMNESHASLRDDYEVTGRELDTLAKLAQDFHGTAGARMTGAGFGGCTVNLVKKSTVEEFISVVGDAYQKTIGYAADFYVTEPSGGPRKYF